MERPALVNGIAYSWVDIDINIQGTIVSGVDEISYKDEQVIEDNFGAGRHPVTRGYGELKAEASITLHAEELVALQSAAPNKRLQDIPPFDVIVSYLPAGGTVTTDVLKNVQFKSNGREPKKGDTSIAFNIPLAVSHIKWGLV